MPYSKSNPPDVIKKLSDVKQKQWISVWNSVFEKTHDEAQAFKTAWGVVKKASCECQDCTPGQITGISVSEGALADATLNKDLLDAKASETLEKVALDILPLNPSMSKALSLTALML